jgi:uncharacterized protein
VITLAKIGWTPVKGTQFNYVPSALLTPRGIPWDRDFYIFDDAGKALILQVSDFLPIRAAYNGQADELTFAFPDGSRVTASAAPRGAQFTYDHFGLRTIALRYLDGELDAALSARVGREIRFARVISTGDGLDLFPVSIVSSESVADLARRSGREGLESARFRSTLEVSGGQPYEEESWVGRHVRIGGAELEIVSGITRCVITTLNPRTGERDHNVVRALSKYRAPITLPEPFSQVTGPPMAVFARVAAPGPVSAGDEVRLVDR